jgi:hypothetical protein
MPLKHWIRNTDGGSEKRSVKFLSFGPKLTDADIERMAEVIKKMYH